VRNGILIFKFNFFPNVVMVRRPAGMLSLPIGRGAFSLLRCELLSPCDQPTRHPRLSAASATTGSKNRQFCSTTKIFWPPDPDPKKARRKMAKVGDVHWSNTRIRDGRAQLFFCVNQLSVY
jgi:hypothetical protein